MKRTLLYFFILIIAAVVGCNKKTETVTVGYRLLLAADPYLPLMKKEAEQFISLYPDAKIDVRGASTREAIVLLLNDSVHTIVVDRQFNEEEKQVAQQASIRLVENKIAEDGIAVIVHPKNPISAISQESVRKIVTSMAEDWSRIEDSHTSGSIDLVLTGRNSGMNENIREKIFHGSKPLEPSTVFNTQREVIQYVAGHPQSIGLVSASLIANEQANVKMLPVWITTPEGKKSVLPMQQEIFDSLYPFHYSLYLYNAEARMAVGGGFTSMVLSTVGQKIFQQSGLAPVSVPYRTIQLTAE